jgi:hypothetical protein
VAGGGGADGGEGDGQGGAGPRQIDPDMAVSIEHEDQELDQLEGLRFAAETLRSAASRSG